MTLFFDVSWKKYATGSVNFFKVSSSNGKNLLADRLDLCLNSFMASSSLTTTPRFEHPIAKLALVNVIDAMFF